MEGGVVVRGADLMPLKDELLVGEVMDDESVGSLWAMSKVLGIAAAVAKTCRMTLQKMGPITSKYCFGIPRFSCN